MSDFHIIILHFLEKTLFVGQGLYILIDLKISFLSRTEMELGITMYEEEQNWETLLYKNSAKGQFFVVYVRDQRNPWEIAYRCEKLGTESGTK